MAKSSSHALKPTEAVLQQAERLAGFGNVTDIAEALMQARADGAQEQADTVPRHLRLALRNAERAIRDQDDAALGTVSEDIQGLVDAAMARIRQAEAERDAITASAAKNHAEDKVALGTFHKDIHKLVDFATERIKRTEARCATALSRIDATKQALATVALGRRWTAALGVQAWMEGMRYLTHEGSPGHGLTLNRILNASSRYVPDFEDEITKTKALEVLRTRFGVRTMCLVPIQNNPFGCGVPARVWAMERPDAGEREWLRHNGSWGLPDRNNEGCILEVTDADTLVAAAEAWKRAQP